MQLTQCNIQKVLLAEKVSFKNSQKLQSWKYTKVVSTLAFKCSQAMLNMKLTPIQTYTHTQHPLNSIQFFGCVFYSDWNYYQKESLQRHEWSSIRSPIKLMTAIRMLLHFALSSLSMYLHNITLCIALLPKRISHHIATTLALNYFHSPSLHCVRFNLTLLSLVILFYLSNSFQTFKYPKSYTYIHTYTFTILMMTSKQVSCSFTQQPPTLYTL